MQKSTITLGEICTIEKGKIGIQAAIPGRNPRLGFAPPGDSEPDGPSGEAVQAGAVVADN